MSVMLWTLKGPIEKRLEQAAAAGCDSVGLNGEHLAWSDARIALVLGLASALRLRIESLCCTPNWSREAVSMVDPAQRPNFLKQVAQSMVFCDKMNIHLAVLRSGDQIVDRPWEEQFSSLVEGTKRAADISAKFGTALLIGPLNNKIDHRGHFLAEAANGGRLCREVNQPGVGLLFNVYHEQVQMGNVTRTLEAVLPHVKLVQVADNPGRRQPGTGEISYPNLYRFLKTKDFRGGVEMEFLPLAGGSGALADAVREARAHLPAN